METMGLDKSFWKNKRVFVSGHTGFKGGWLTIWLKSLGARVSGYSLPPPTAPNLFEVAEVENGIDSRIGDVLDRVQLGEFFRRSQPEIVFHLAAQPLVRDSYVSPVETFATNIMGTVNILDEVRRIGNVRSVLVITSDKCYENREWAWGYREADVLGGHDPYSSSKACAELVTASYRRSYFNPKNHSKHGTGLATARAGNVIGGGDWAKDRLIPDIFRAIEHQQPLIIRNPLATRPWQHVLEPLRGYLMLSQKLYEEGSAYSEAWNFGPDDSDIRDVGWITSHVMSCLGEGATWEIEEGFQPHEAGSLKLDCAKSKLKLRWNPILAVEDALERTSSWHTAYVSETNMREFTLSQIREIEEMDKERG